MLKQQIESRVYGSAVAAIGYLNERDQITLIAHPQDSWGVITNGGVIYSHAFDGIDADVQYKVHNWGIEQDVIIYGGLPPVANPKQVRLCILTEIVGQSSTNIGVQREGDILPADASKASLELFGQDQDGWYRMHNFHRSYAFPVRGSGWSVGGRQQEGHRVPVGLRLVDIQGKLYLCEELPLSHIAQTAPQTFTASKIALQTTALEDLDIPYRRQGGENFQLARVEPMPRQGTPYVIDVATI